MDWRKDYRYGREDDKQERRDYIAQCSQYAFFHVCKITTAILQ